MKHTNGSTRVRGVANGLAVRLCIWILATLPCAGADYYTDAINGSDVTGNGSAGNPWQTIQHAVNSISEAGAVLHVAAGTYAESVTVSNTCAGLHLSGAGAGQTVIDASGISKNGGVVQFDSVNGCRVSGFTLTGGDNAGSSGPGGAIRALGSSAYIQVDANSITNNEARSGGGGAMDLGDNCVVSNNLIIDNWCEYGPGAITIGSGSVIADNVIDGNYSTYGCAALSVNDTNIIVRGNLFRGNRGDEGAIYGKADIYNNLFEGNQADENGGASYLTGGRFMNNTLSGNKCGTAYSGSGLYCYSGNIDVLNNIITHGTNGVGLHVRSGATVNADFNCFWQNTGGAYGGIATNGASDVSDDPLFDSSGLTGFELDPLSPCIDHGTNQTWMVSATDYSGKARIINLTVDMGAHESGWSIAATAGDHGAISPTGTVWVGHGLNQAFSITADQHYHIISVLVNGNPVGSFNRGSNTYTYTFQNVTSNQTIDVSFRIDWHTLQIVSERGVCAPPTGILTNDYGTVLSNRVTNPVITEGTTQYWCSGWRMNGSDPASGASSSMTMILTNDAVLSWLWSTNYWLDAIPADAGQHGSVSADNGWCLSGTREPILATPSNYYHFMEWSGDTDLIETGGIGASAITVRIDRAVALVGHFGENLCPKGTPEWWMALHALTNGGFAVAETNDLDGDGMLAWEEYVADTIPTNVESVLLILGITAEPGGIAVRWKGGEQVRQFLQCRQSLTSTTEQWVAVWTNEPPTPITTNYTHSGALIGQQFYRINVER
jgi:hypothetical protein